MKNGRYYKHRGGANEIFKEFGFVISSLLFHLMDLNVLLYAPCFLKQLVNSSSPIVLFVLIKNATQLPRFENQWWGPVDAV